jgi:hypothetical protein
VGPKFFESVDIFDWYDGFVLAVVRRSSDGTLFLVSMIAFDPGAHERILVLRPLSAGEADLLKEKSKASLEEIEGLVRRLIAEGPATLQLVRVNNVSEQPLAEGFVERDRIKDLVPSSVDDAVSDTRRTWFKTVS